MLQPQHQHGGTESGDLRLSRFIAAHIANGNKPDYELGQRKLAQFEESVFGLEPPDLTDQEIVDFIRAHRARGRG
jgi:hypothetical protein